MDMFSIQIALYFLSLAFSHRFLARADDVVGCGGFVQSEVEINYSLVQVKYRIKTNLSKNEVLGYKERFFYRSKSRFTKLYEKEPRYNETEATTEYNPNPLCLRYIMVPPCRA